MNILCPSVQFCWQLKNLRYKFNPVIINQIKRGRLGLVTGMKGMIYRVSQEECAILPESVPYVKVYRYNPKHLYPKLDGYGDNGQRKMRSSYGSTYCTCLADALRVHQNAQ